MCEHTQFNNNNNKNVIEKVEKGEMETKHIPYYYEAMIT